MDAATSRDAIQKTESTHACATYTLTRVISRTHQMIVISDMQITVAVCIRWCATEVLKLNIATCKLYGWVLPNVIGMHVQG